MEIYATQSSLKKGLIVPMGKVLLAVSGNKVLPQFLHEVAFFSEWPRTITEQGPKQLFYSVWDPFPGQPLLQRPLLGWQRRCHVSIIVQQQLLPNPASLPCLSQVLLPSALLVLLIPSQCLLPG